ncbi:MAG: hypothetical protein ABIH34_07950 [Nanoarchaeota archaeon]
MNKWIKADLLLIFITLPLFTVILFTQLLVPPDEVSHSFNNTVGAFLNVSIIFLGIELMIAIIYFLVIFVQKAKN